MSNDKKRSSKKSNPYRQQLPSWRLAEIERRVKRGFQFMLRGRSSGWINQILHSRFSVIDIEFEAIDDGNPLYSEFKAPLVYLRDSKRVVSGMYNLVSHGFDVEDEHVRDLRQFEALERQWKKLALEVKANGYPSVPERTSKLRMERLMKSCPSHITHERKLELYRRVWRGVALLKKYFEHEWEDRVLSRHFQFKLMDLHSGGGLYPFLQAYWMCEQEKRKSDLMPNVVYYGFDVETRRKRRQKDFVALDYFWTHEARRSVFAERG